MAPPPREAFHGQGGAAAHKIKKAVHIIFEPLCPLKGRQPFWQRGWNQMKRSTGLWTAGALIFAIVIGVFSVYSYNLNTRAGQEAQRPVTDLPIEGEGEIPEDYQYILRAQDGRIAVFLPQESEPKMIFDVPVAVLPEYDQRQLESWIYVPDYQTLVTLIEDYIS